MTKATGLDQLHIEMINRARMDPLQEMRDAGLTSLNQGIDTTKLPTISDAPKQVLAGNDQLAAAATGHTNFMVANQLFNHDGIGDGTPTSRIAAAGYLNNTAARNENFGVANWEGQFTPQQLAQKLASDNHLGLFNDLGEGIIGDKGGHRVTYLDPDLKEVGVGASFTSSPTPNGILGHYVMTENFGANSAKSFLTGAVYNDTVVVDKFYSLGEGVAGTTVKVFDKSGNQIGTDSTGEGGGWSVAEDGGTFKVTFTQGGKDISATVEAGSLNAKVDLVNGTDIYANANATLGTGATNLRLLGVQNINGTGNGSSNTLTGNKGDNALEGRGGNDTIDGGDGVDMAIFSGAQSNYKITLQAGGKAIIEDKVGGDGIDTIVNVEKVSFGGKIVDFSSLKDSAGPAANTAPVVTVKSFSVDTHDTQSLASFFTATDKDGNGTITQYAFKDGGTASGKIVIDGKAQAADTWIIVNAKDLDQVKYVAGATVDSEKITIKAFDGQAWSTEKALTVSTTARAVSDFGDNGKSDILFHNDKTGEISTWQMNGSSVNLAKAIAGMSSTWDVAGVGDFSRDGKADVLWEKSDGSLQLWQMNGSTATSKVTLASKADAGSHVVAVADFNADGKADILFSTDTGKVSVWEMDGSKIVSKGVVGSAGTGWLVEDAADISGNGKADVLMRNTNTGDVKVWLMDGSTKTLEKTIGNVTKDWAYVGSGDFNADGHDDFVWQKTDGSVQIWQMDGTTVDSKVTIGKEASSAWHVTDIGDYNNDGHADLLWRHETSGATKIWEMDGNTVLSKEAITGATTLGADWHVV
ncbi:FG-GAP repeat protein [Variibacter gotjawalensis]|uniref:FG-GAP repeat protein n=1 Tax=Variibacter gotjawalensis TaxID=1333996 RepID=A0A0S3PR87_9BRAD|nr:FG-GAP-like repeat-containing protein [Variibacter gotjawalensis]NIK48758.1 hypothetical protein [Variibacter gotjawalensis]RZS50619.1 VCBS repeat protein [Variibacter gotjawalensis]BAT58453.1 FG-GAP repeat protein [Variibacter gotjawalensis]